MDYEEEIFSWPFVGGEESADSEEEERHARARLAYTRALAPCAVHAVNRTVMLPILERLQAAFPLLWAVTGIAGYGGAALAEFARFMALKVLKKDWRARKLSPGNAVDEIWHRLLLRPRAYDAFCMQLCGRTIDHRPRFNGHQQARNLRLQATAALHSNVFVAGSLADTYHGAC